mgnify:CR=1 FL=1
MHWTLNPESASRMIEDSRAGRVRQDLRRLTGSGRDMRPDIERVCSSFREKFADLRANTGGESGCDAPRDQSADVAKDSIEGRLSCLLFEGLKDIDARVLTDAGFWRYLAVCEMFEYIEWRDGSDCGLPSFGAGTHGLTWDCASKRMFVRGRIAKEARSNESWQTVARIAGTDVWRSHILRVRTGESPQLACALLEAWDRREIRTKEIRDVAKRIKRLRSNLVFEVMDQTQIQSMLERQIEAIRRDG